MACNITSGIALDCMDSIGGIKVAYLGINLSWTSFTYGTNSIIVGATGAGVTQSFYEYELPKDTGSITETFNISNTNGTAFYSQALTINLQKLDAAKRAQLLLLSRNRNITMIVVDNNDKIWMLGQTRGGVLTQGTSVTGVAPGDANQYSITITADEPAMMYEVQSLAVFSGISFVSA